MASPSRRCMGRSGRGVVLSFALFGVELGRCFRRLILTSCSGLTVGACNSAISGEWCLPHRGNTHTAADWVEGTANQNMRHGDKTHACVLYVRKTLKRKEGTMVALISAIVAAISAVGTVAVTIWEFRRGDDPSIDEAPSRKGDATERRSGDHTP